MSRITPIHSLPWIEPLVPKRRPQPFNDKAWSFEPKLDGFRGVLYFSPEMCQIRSKEGKHLTRFDELCKKVIDELQKKNVQNIILDGEIVVVNEEGKPQFMDLLRNRGTPEYVAFDILWLNGVDLREVPLQNRRRVLYSVISKKSRVMTTPLAVREHGTTLFNKVCDFDMEGVIAKRLSDPYKKRAIWYKIINPEYSQLRGRKEMFEGFRAAKTK